MTGIKLSPIFLANFKGDAKLRRMDVTSLESRVSHLGHIDAIKAALTLISLSSEIRNKQAELAQLYDAHNKLSYLRSFTGTLSVSQQINWAEIWYQIALRAEKQTFNNFLNFTHFFSEKERALLKSEKRIRKILLPRTPNSRPSESSEAWQHIVCNSVFYYI